jgi:hypothetical protein
VNTVGIVSKEKGSVNLPLIARFPALPGKGSEAFSKGKYPRQAGAISLVELIGHTLTGQMPVLTIKL